MLRKKEIMTAVGSLACAIGIGYVMQSSDVANKRYGNVTVAKADIFGSAGQRSDDSLLEVQEIKLTSGELENKLQVPETDSQVVTASAPQSSLPEPQAPELVVEPPCTVSATARPIAAAMVSVSMKAACLPNERVTVHHSGMIFSQMTSEDGALNVTVPALTEDAVFIMAFSNGEGAVAQAKVPELKSFERVVLQWRGETGFQLHAREFGAGYGEGGHVWADAARSMAAIVTDEGGFLSRNGDSNAPDALIAEVYTFPSSATLNDDTVLLTVEAEVVTANCGREIEAKSMELNRNMQLRTRDLTLAVPDCDAIGSFLVLNNLFGAVKVAQN